MFVKTLLTDVCNKGFTRPHGILFRGKYLNDPIYVNIKIYITRGGGVFRGLKEGIHNVVKVKEVIKCSLSTKGCLDGLFTNQLVNLQKLKISTLQH